MRVEFKAGPDDADRRLETVVRRLCPQITLGGLHKALRKGDIRLNGAKAGPDSRVAAGDTVAVWEALLPDIEVKTGGGVLPPSWVLWEGSDLIVLNKPSGILVHRGEAPRSGEAPLDELVRNWLAPTSAASLAFRPGPLHRLDRETSGLVVFSRTLAGARAFSLALAERRVAKTYLAVMKGELTAAREVNAALGRDGPSRTSSVEEDGEASESRFRPLATASGLTLAEVDLGTGRTHQIRVHAQSLGLPLAGDAKYGGGAPPPGLDVPWLLHAWKLSSDLLPPLTAPLPSPRASWVEKTFKISL